MRNDILTFDFAFANFLTSELIELSYSEIRVSFQICYFVDSEDPEAYRYAPANGGVANYVITETRLAAIRSQFMYWYFDKGGDNDRGDYQIDLHASTARIHKNFNFQLPFFGFRFNYTQVSASSRLFKPIRIPLPGSRNVVKIS